MSQLDNGLGEPLPSLDQEGAPQPCGFTGERNCHMSLHSRLSPLFAPAWAAAFSLAGVALTLGTLRASSGSDLNNGAQVIVTPVSGPSWLNRLTLRFDLSCMGRTGRWGPKPLHSGEDGSPLPKLREGQFHLTGEDLYRLSCRSCHRPDGRGCGSEIKSLIEPVRAASVTMVQANMTARGLSIPMSLAQTLASQAAQTLYDRLKNGGEKMPPYRHLSSREVEALLGYLRKLAGDSGLKTPPSVPASPLRVGELLVKGTCHICHDTLRPIQWYINNDQDIPPLAELPRTRSLQQFLSKVLRGAATPQEKRGRMPIFSYLTEEEVTAAYNYLLLFSSEPALAASPRRIPPRP